MSFRVLDCSVEMVKELRGVLGQVERKDGDLARQVRRAASSVALNLAEANGRDGKDRLHHFRIARGSAFEVQTGLRLCVAWGHVADAAAAPAMSQATSLLRMLTGLVR